MRYEKLVEKVSAHAGLGKEVVKAVLFAFPDGLASLELGDKVRTPLGVFRMVQRGAMTVTPPGGTEPVEVEAERVVRLHSGIRLRRKA